MPAVAASNGSYAYPAFMFSLDDDAARGDDVAAINAQGKCKTAPPTYAYVQRPLNRKNYSQTTIDSLTSWRRDMPRRGSALLQLL
jgi:hypothetical protein